MTFKHLSLLVFFCAPLSAYAQSSERAVNIRTDAFLFAGGASLGDSDKIRWDFYKADRAGKRTDTNVGGAYDATFAEFIPAGRYVAVAVLGNIKREVPFTIVDGKVTEISATFDAGELTIKAKRDAASPIVEPLARIEARGHYFLESFYGSRSFYVPAGEVTLVGTLGPARAEEKLSIKAGEKLTHEFVIPSGVVVTKATYAEGGLAVETGAVQFQVVSAEQTLDGSHNSISSIFGVDKPMQLGTGKYLMRAKLGQVTAEAPFEILAGKRTDLTINLNAGVLAIAAPDAERIDIFRRSNDLQKTEESVSARYGTEHQDTLPPGTYSVKISYPVKLKLEPRIVETEVTAAKRTDLEIERSAITVEPSANN